VPAVAWVYPDKPYGFGGIRAGMGCMWTGCARWLHPNSRPVRSLPPPDLRRCPFKALAPLFKGEAFDPGQWAALFKRAGARYAFLTSNFHDGYCLWPSPYNPGWNSLDIGPNATCSATSVPPCGRPACARASTTRSLNSIIRSNQAARKPGGNLQRSCATTSNRSCARPSNAISPPSSTSTASGSSRSMAFEMRDFLTWLYAESALQGRRWSSTTASAAGRAVNTAVFISSEAGVRESSTAHKWSEIAR